jgi:serine/threonine protein kinase
MNTDPRISSMLLRWQQLRLQDRILTPDELCADCPELLDEVRREIEKLLSMEVMVTGDAQELARGPVVDSNPTRTVEDRPYPEPRHAAPPGYEVLGELGRGGMGVVFRARQLALNRIVALKMLRGGATAGVEELRRFRREAEAVAALHHPNIIQIFEVGDTPDGPFFALELVAGGSLAERLSRGPMPPQETAALVETLARAVEHAHRQGLLHRDLKPANVLLMPDPGGQPAIPKVTDFGLAKRLDGQGNLTQSGALLGTPAYMAPEQAGGQSEQLGPAVDVWALGVILYECLTGVSPFLGKELMETLDGVLNEEPVAPSRLNRQVPRDLETICLKCLDKDSRRRYASAGELADDLRRFQQWEPIRARRVGRLERLYRWTRRRPARVLAALLVLVVVGSSASGYLLWQDARKRSGRGVHQAAPPAHEHFAALAYRQGIPEGVGPLNDGEVAQAVRTFHVQRRGDQVERIDVLDRGDPTADPASWPELLGLPPPAGLPPYRTTHRFSYEEGRLRRQEALDPSGQLLWSMTWESPDSVVLVDRRGGPASEKRLDVRLSWSEEGWPSGVHFVDRQGRAIVHPVAGGGRTFECDSRGLIVRVTESGATVKLTRTRTYDAQGRCTSEVFHHAAGEPAEKAGVHRQEYRFNSPREVESVARDSRGQPTTGASTGIHRAVVRHDERLRESEISFFGPSGQPAWHQSLKCSRLTTRFDESGNMMERSSRVNLPDGTWALCRREDRDGRVLEETHYAAEGQPRNNADGWAKQACKCDPAGEVSERVFYKADLEGRLKLWKREDGKGRVVEQVNLDKDGRPQQSPEGCYGWTVRYDSYGNKIEDRSFDRDGKPTILTYGYHRWIDRFDDRNNLLEAATFGVNGEPAFDKADGSFRFLHRYDSRNKRIETLHLGPNSRPMNLKSGWAQRREAYDSAGNLAEIAFWKADPQGKLQQWLRKDGKDHVLEEFNLTVDGRPVTWPAGHHRYTSRYDSRGNPIDDAFFGLDGKPMVISFGYHRKVTRWDDKGRRLEQAFFGVNGEPVFDRTNGWFRGLASFYDSRNTCDLLNLGPSGRPANVKDGWAKRRDIRDRSGKTVESIFWKADTQGKLRLWKREDSQGRMLEFVNLSEDGEPKRMDTGQYGWTERFDSRGNRIEGRNFDRDGKPTVPNFGFHRYVARFDDRNNLLERANLGINDEPAFDADEGCFRSLHRYDSRNRRTETLILGPNSRPMNLKIGWAQRREVYDGTGNLAQTVFWKADPQGKLQLWQRKDGQGRMIEEVNLTADGRPQPWAAGHYRVTYRYDFRGHEVEEAFFGREGEPVVSAFGYHRSATRRDRQGRHLEHIHFGLAGKRVSCRKCGFSRGLFRYDDRGNRVETLFLGPNDRPYNGTQGWARMRTTHVAGEAKPREQYWTAGPDGTLVPFSPKNSRPDKTPGGK